MHWPVRQKTPAASPALSNAQVAAGTADHSADSDGAHLRSVQPHYTTVAHALHSRPLYIVMNIRNESTL